MTTIKTVYAPHLKHDVRIGGRVRADRSKDAALRLRMHFAHYARQLPEPPASRDYSPAALASIRNVYLNSTYGDCVIAGGYHFEGVTTGNATGSPFVATDEQILHDYEMIGGFDPNNPIATDNGCNEEVAFRYWSRVGFANGDKLSGYVLLDATNKRQLKQAINLFEGATIGVELPDSWIAPFPSGDDFVWDVAEPNPRNGHDVQVVGYDDVKGLKVATWGLLGWITWPAAAALLVESAGGAIYGLLNPSMIDKCQTKAPNGLDWETLVMDFDSLGGNVAPPMVASPRPSAQDLRTMARNKLRKP